MVEYYFFNIININKYILMKIILLLFLFLILFYYIKTLCKKEDFDTEYNSITKIKGDYEIYSENDKFYPSHKINIKKEIY
jgi:hypothetical protein